MSKKNTYYWRHRKEILEKKRKYRQTPEYKKRNREYMKGYYHKHKEKILLYRKIQYRKKRGCLVCGGKLELSSDKTHLYCLRCGNIKEIE